MTPDLASARALLAETVSDFHDYIGQTVAGDKLVKRIGAAATRPEE